MTILILEPVLALAESLAIALRQNTAARKVRVTADFAQACEQLQIEPADLLLVSAMIGEQQCLRLFEIIKESGRDTALLVLGVEPDEDRILSFVEAGAVAFLECPEPLRELFQRIEAANNKESYCSTDVLLSALKRIKTLSARRRAALGPGGDLTVREQEILNLVAAGYRNKEISERLEISLFTVKNHIHQILTKLHASRREEAVRRAYESGLFKSEVRRHWQ